MKWEDFAGKETTFLRYVYLVTARSDALTVVKFLFIACIDSRAASKLFGVEAFFLYQIFLSLKNSSPPATVFPACLYKDSCQKLSYYSLFLNQYTEKVTALLPTSKT